MLFERGDRLYSGLRHGHVLLERVARFGVMSRQRERRCEPDARNQYLRIDRDGAPQPINLSGVSTIETVGGFRVGRISGSS